MNRSLSRRRNSGSGIDEVEALQTDIMRFLAIICMCLMIVFSLVQSIPVSSRNNKPDLSSKALVEDEVRALKKVAQRLIAKIAILENSLKVRRNRLIQIKSTLSNTEADLEKLHDKENKKEQEIKQQQLALIGIQEKIEGLRTRITNSLKTVKEAKENLEKKETALSDVSKLVQNGRTTMLKIRKEIEKATLNMKEVQNTRKTSKQEAKQNPKEKEIVKPKQKHSDFVQKKGFSLRFESNSTLEYLLRNDDRVKLYMMAGGKTWVLKVSRSGVMNFFPAGSPRFVYDMDISTVPLSIKRSGKKVVAAFGKDHLAYAVTLASDIRRELSQIMSLHKGGEIIISKHGNAALVF